VQTTNTSIEAPIQAKMPENARQSDTLPLAPPAALGRAERDEPAEPAERRARDLPPLESLDADSDYTPFMAREVDPATRNAAMKKLFTDPHYNVMDGLDIYIDDYGKPDPLPPDWIQKMTQSVALGLIEPTPDDIKATERAVPSTATAAEAEVSGQAMEGANAEAAAPVAGPLPASQGDGSMHAKQNIPTDREDGRANE
jgi:hypothetical protein